MSLENSKKGGDVPDPSLVAVENNLIKVGRVINCLMERVNMAKTSNGWKRRGLHGICNKKTALIKIQLKPRQ